MEPSDAEPMGAPMGEPMEPAAAEPAQDEPPAEEFFQAEVFEADPEFTFEEELFESDPEFALEKELFESYGEAAFLGETGPAAQPAKLVYRLNPAGCPQGGAAVLRTAIRDAMRFATSAARKLETGDATAARIFQSLFGHPPTRPVPWANNRTSGAIVAHRIRRVAQALQGRGTHYRCGCPGLPATVNAFAAPPNAVALCARFWQQSRAFRAGIVFHEMLHLLYAGFLRHDQRERRRNNAHCYEAFVLRVAGHTPDPSDVTQCRDRPA